MIDLLTNGDESNVVTTGDYRKFATRHLHYQYVKMTLYLSKNIFILLKTYFLGTSGSPGN